MTGTVITLIVIGLIFIFASFFISEAVSDSLNEYEDEETPELEITLTDNQKAKLHQDVETEVKYYCDQMVYQVGEQLAAISNEKMLALGDYAVSVYEEIEKTHKEVMFLYGMLGDKEKELKLLVEQVDVMKQEMKETADQSQRAVEEAIRAAEDSRRAVDLFDDTLQDAKETDSDEMPKEQPYTKNEGDSVNEIILELKRSGMGMIEIARQLGLGVGEVKLVVDLYDA